MIYSLHVTLSLATPEDVGVFINGFYYNHTHFIFLFVFWESLCGKAEYLLAGNMVRCLTMICEVHKLFIRVGERKKDCVCGNDRTQSLRIWNKGFNKAVTSGWWLVVGLGVFSLFHLPWMQKGQTKLVFKICTVGIIGEISWHCFRNLRQKPVEQMHMWKPFIVMNSTVIKVHSWIKMWKGKNQWVLKVPRNTNLHML